MTGYRPNRKTLMIIIYTEIKLKVLLNFLKKYKFLLFFKNK